MQQTDRRTITRFAVFLILFLVAHLFNAFFLTIPAINRNMNMISPTFFSFINRVLGDLSVLIVLIAIALFAGRTLRAKRNHLIVFSLVLTLIAFGLKVYLYYYGTFFTFFIIQNFTNPQNEMAYQIVINTFQRIASQGILFTLFPFFVVLGYGLFGLGPVLPKRKADATDNRWLRLRVIRMFVIGILTLFLTQSGATLIPSNDYFANHRNSLYNVRSMGVYSYFLSDLFGKLLDDGVSIDDTEQASLDAYVTQELTNPCYEEACTYTDALSPFRGVFAGKNLVILQLESLNSFVIGRVGNNIPVMPFLSSLTEQADALYYPNFFSVAGIGKTTDAEFAALTGFYPTGQVITYFENVTPGLETLAKLFQDQNYQTKSLHGSPEIFYHRNTIHPILGFDSTSGTETIDVLREHQLNGWTTDTHVFNHVVTMLQDASTANLPLFSLTLSTMLHMPYFPSAAVDATTDWGLEPDSMMSGYFDYANAADRDLAVLFADLEDAGLLEDTVFMMYGDHTSSVAYEEFRAIHPDITPLEYQRALQNVPFLMYAPGFDWGDVDTTLVRSQIDVKRTVANLFGLNLQYYNGVDILSNQPTVAYNPLNLDIVADGVFLSAANRCYVSAEVLPQARISALIDAFYASKNRNDLLLQTHYFK